jgi:uncharacterized Zn finger protein
MPKEKLPKLTETQIRALANSQSFQRGEDYFRRGAILEPMRQGLELRAECGGSEYEPYQVHVTLNAQGIAITSCTCPYDWGDICKHRVALLLTYIHTPEVFRVVAPLDKLLADKSKEELIAIIQDLLRHKPGLLAIVELTTATQEIKTGKPMNVSTCRTQARRALQQDSPRQVKRELRSLKDIAARVAKSGDYLNAGAIYHALLDEAAKGYDDLISSMDEDGDICTLVDDFAKGLGKCFTSGKPDEATRREWLKTLLEAELADIALGGIDLAPSAGDILFKQATVEDWLWIEELLRQAIQRSKGEWQRESLVEFLSEGLQKCGRKKEINALIEQQGSEEQQLFLLIKKKQIDEALRRMHDILKRKPGLLSQFADALVQAKVPQVAVNLVKQQEKSWQSYEWLAAYYGKHGTPQQALESHTEHFFFSPSVEKFKTLSQMSLKLNNWETLRGELLAELEHQENFSTLIEIALHEGDAARALALLPQVNIGWRYEDNYQLKVARVAEKDFPQEALALYKTKIERLIEQRGRDNYGEAVTLLKRVNAIYQRLDKLREWNLYINALRTQHAKLRALQEELATAKL